MKAQPYIEDWKQVQKKEKVVIISILVGAFFLGLSGAIQIFKLARSNPAESLLPKQPASKAVVSLSSQSKVVNQGDNFTVTVTVDTGATNVEAADFVVNYDQKYLQAVSVNPGDFFKVYPKKEASGGKVWITGIAQFENNTFTIPKGKGSVGQITFQAVRKTNNTALKIDKQKTIVASKGKNILGNTQNLVLKIQ